MGYESRFYIVLKTAGDDFDHIGKSLTYFYAEFNVGKLGVQDMLSKFPDTDMYFYISDEKYIIEDSYGDELKELTIPEAIELMEYARKLGGTTWPKIEAFYHFLLFVNNSDWDRFRVLHYGY